MVREGLRRFSGTQITSLPKPRLATSRSGEKDCPADNPGADG